MPSFLRPRPGHPFLAGAPLLIAHRGGSRLAPENTMEAFGSALRDWNADVLEMDVRLTRDGHILVIHDATVDRTTDGSGPVAALTLAEVQALDAGYRFVDEEGRATFRGRGVRIPRFEEVLVAFPGVRLNVEAKEPAVARPLADIIRRHGAERRVLFAAEHERSRAGVHGYAGPWGASREHAYRFYILHRFAGGRLYTPGADALQVPETSEGRRVVTPRFIERAHARNLPVHVWTVDEPADMHRLLDWGVDGIQTDRPDRLAAVLNERTGRPLPPGLRGNPGGES